MERLINALKAQAGAINRSLGQPRFGTVSSFDSSNFTARVQLQPEGVVTGWLPVLSPLTGQGWGMVCPLAFGDQVLVLPQEGDAEHGVIVGRAFSKLSPPPSTPTGEVWITHPSGCCLKLRNDGSILIEGDLHVNGQIFDNHNSLAHLRSSHNNHKHFTASGSSTSTSDITD